jgi:hypothetical protein
MRRVLVLLMILSFLSSAAYAIQISVGPTFGMRFGEGYRGYNDYFGPVFGFKGDLIFPQPPFNGMFAISPALEFSVDDVKIFNINFAGKFRYPTGNLVPYGHMGFAIAHSWDGGFSNNSGEFLLGGGVELIFKPKMSFGFQLETLTFDFVDLEGMVNFYL